MLIGVSDLTLECLQWDLVPESFNLGIYPLAHKRVDFELAATNTETPSRGTISPWSTSKLLNKLNYILVYNLFLGMVRSNNDGG